VKLVYIAGPFTAPDPAENIRAAQLFALPLVGYCMPVVPHSMTIGLPGGTPQLWYDGTLELMRRCDAVLAMPNWQQSKGALSEVRVADREEIAVFYDHDSLLRWLEGECVGTRDSQRGTLEELLAGLPQTLQLRHVGRVQEVRAWRLEADDGLLYEARTIDRIRISTKHDDVVFEQVDDAAPVADLECSQNNRIKVRPAVPTVASIFAEVDGMPADQVIDELRKIAADPGPYQHEAQVVLEQGRTMAAVREQTPSCTGGIVPIGPALQIVHGSEKVIPVKPGQVFVSEPIDTRDPNAFQRLPFDFDLDISKPGDSCLADMESALEHAAAHLAQQKPIENFVSSGHPVEESALREYYEKRDAGEICAGCATTENLGPAQAARGGIVILCPTCAQKNAAAREVPPGTAS
jgi:hypothetical protein